MGIAPILFTRLHPVAHLSTGRARGFRLAAKKAQSQQPRLGVRFLEASP